MEAESFSMARVENHCPKSLDELACVGIPRALPLLQPSQAKLSAVRPKPDDPSIRRSPPDQDGYPIADWTPCPPFEHPVSTRTSDGGTSLKTENSEHVGITDPSKALDQFIETP